jgi:alanine racemase
VTVPSAAPRPSDAAETVPAGLPAGPSERALPPGVLREALIDTGAMSANIRHLRRLTGVEVMAVVKADGYGHGAVRSAMAALDGGASHLGVADVAEALALRRAGIDAPILAWLHAPETGFAEPAARGIELGISSFDQVQRAAAAATADRPVGVHLKLETGLGRNGIPPEDFRVVFAEAARLERVGRLRVNGLWSHLSNTSADDDRAALRAFLEAVGLAAALGLTPRVRHIAATHAAIALPEARLDLVRIGIGLYGLSPFDDRTSADLGLRPAMTLHGAVAAVRSVPSGHGVSYGYVHRAATETTLALVPIGYADGVPRQASGAGAVVIGGRTFPVAGRVAMDQFVVDVGDHPVTVGDEAVLFGDPTLGMPSATDWADAAGTINYEIVTRIGPRVPRRALPW